MEIEVNEYNHLKLECERLEKILEEKDIETEKLYDKIDSLSFRIEELETEKSDLEYEIVDKTTKFMLYKFLLGIMRMQ